MINQWQRGEFCISTDKQRLNLESVHGFLSNAYWSPGVPLEVVRRSIEHSLAFGVYQGDQQVGFARVTTDYATFAYLSDVFILEPFRGYGLATWLIEVILNHPDLQGLRRWLLVTRDAHELYRKFGFTEIANPGRFMERARPNMYTEPEVGQS